MQRHRDTEKHRNTKSQRDAQDTRRDTETRRHRGTHRDTDTHSDPQRHSGTQTQITYGACTRARTHTRLLVIICPTTRSFLHPRRNWAARAGVTAEPERPVVAIMNFIHGTAFTHSTSRVPTSLNCSRRVPKSPFS
eukprot:1505612-Alexandrium_andersonii.AAC.1